MIDGEDNRLKKKIHWNTYRKTDREDIYNELIDYWYQTLLTNLVAKMNEFSFWLENASSSFAFEKYEYFRLFP